MKTILFILLILFTTSCLFDLGAGTHGKIKGYKYSVTKSELENVILDIVQKDSSIKSDFRAGHYNDSKYYLTMTIKSQDNEYKYTFRYYGDSLDWAKSKTSEIFICYIFDGKGNGGSEGDGKFEKLDSKVQMEMISLFENKLVAKIDKALNKKHLVD